MWQTLNMHLSRRQTFTLPKDMRSLRTKTVTYTHTSICLRLCRASLLVRDKQPSESRLSGYAPNSTHTPFTQTDLDAAGRDTQSQNCNHYTPLGSGGMPRKEASESSVAACALPAAPGCKADACSASSEVYSRSRRPCSTLGGAGPSHPLPPGCLSVAAGGFEASAAPTLLSLLLLLPSLLLLLSLSLLLLPSLLLSLLLSLLPSSLLSREESSSEELSDEYKDAEDSECEVEEDRPPEERTRPCTAVPAPVWPVEAAGGKSSIQNSLQGEMGRDGQGGEDVGRDEKGEAQI